MNWKAHIAGGFVLSLLFLFLNYNYKFIELETSFSFIILSVGIIMFYSLVPDLDHQISKLTFIITVFMLFLCLYLVLIKDFDKIIYLIVILIVLWLLPKIKGFGHRGHYHSIIFGIIVCIPILFISWKLSLIAFISFFSHLLCDWEFKFW